MIEMKNRKLYALLCAAAMVFSFTGCLEDPVEDDERTLVSEDETDAAVAENETDAAASGEETDTEAANDGQIKRKRRTTETPMGDPGTWTVMVYMCGSNLESEGGMASTDIAEMLESSVKDNIRFLVCTGGAEQWQNGISAEKNQVYCISDGNAELVAESDKSDMGDASTLHEFLHYGVQNYPAANMGLVFWNHGGGSITGVCFDDFYEGDSLFLKEIDAALYSVYDEMTCPFEFIGFDACLMSTVETAAILASHARYMVASEEIEPGYGWDYTAIGNSIASNPNESGAELGKVICDSFYESCKAVESEEAATLSVIDLRKVDDLMLAFDSYAKDIYELTEQESTDELAKVIRSITAADNFGGNTKSTYYTNMVDLGGIIEAGTDYSGNASAALTALKNAVVYTKNGSDHKNACGLSSYYPLKIEGSQELGIFKDICISSYYLGLIDKLAYGAAGAGDIGRYDNSSLLSSFLADWSDDEYDSDEDYTYEPEPEELWDTFDNEQAGGTSELISFELEPTFNEDGDYGFILTQDALAQTDYVEAAVYMMTDDLTEIIELGYTGDIYSDWEHGMFIDNFDGFWFSLPDGQLLAAYLMQECDGYDLYTSPILLNGEETNLIFAYDYENTEVYFISVWDGISETGASSRGEDELKAGDTIVPIYYATEIETEEQSYYYGDEYVYDGESEPSFNYLYDGEYLYGFIINDIFGNYYETDYINFTVKDDEIYFDALED